MVLYSGLKAPGPDREIAQVIDPLADDDREKNKILLSENTDYSTPDESRALVISEHVVAPGENLSAIAKQYGISIDTICGSNNLTSYDFIREGVHLKIPNKDGIIYRMKDGNNIAGIAERYRVSLEKIIAENRIENPDFVPVDAVLFIPDAKPQNIVNGFMWPCSSRVITCGYGWRQNPRRIPRVSSGARHPRQVRLGALFEVREGHLYGLARRIRQDDRDRSPGRMEDPVRPSVEDHRQTRPVRQTGPVDRQEREHRTLDRAAPAF